VAARAAARKEAIVAIEISKLISMERVERRIGDRRQSSYTLEYRSLRAAIICTKIRSAPRGKAMTASTKLP
jgi:hypothetical protein